METYRFVAMGAAMTIINLLRPHDTILEIKPPRKPREGGLGERQLRWCRERLPNFEHCQKAADAAAEHTRVVRDKMMGQR